MNILEDPYIKIEMKYVQIISNFYIWNANFYCSGYGLTSLKGCPRIIKGEFNCGTNKLTSLKYCPVEVRGDFFCSVNLLESLEYCPKYVDGNFYCGNNKVQFTEEYVRFLCEVKGKVIC